MTTATAFAPGKLIVVGEHAVVYGHPALAVAVDRGTTVHLRRRPGPTLLETPFADDPRLPAALTAVLPDQGIGVAVECDLPIGRGMGSSAALAVALARAWSALEERIPTPERIASDAMRVERIFHGDPSGIDHTVSMTGGAVLFERGEAGPVFQTIPFPDLPLVVIDSGVAGDTATMVAGVRDRRPGCDPVLAQIGALVRAFMDALPIGDPHALGQLLMDNHGFLQRLGVSTPGLDAIVDAALTAGATGAKLAGAGGGGVVVALAPHPEPVITAAQRQGHTAFAVRIAAAT